MCPPVPGKRLGEALRGVLVEAQPSCDGHREAHPICRHCHLGLKVDSGVLECN